MLDAMVCEYHAADPRFALTVLLFALPVQLTSRSSSIVMPMFIVPAGIVCVTMVMSELTNDTVGVPSPATWGRLIVSFVVTERSTMA